MTEEQKAMSLEEFEDRRGHSATAGTGKVQGWLRELQPLTPTLYPAGDKTPRNVRTIISGAWRGGNKLSVTAIRDEKGGALRTTTIGEELWVVWYPEENNGA